MEFLTGLLPLAVFLICPLMMIFMMRGMHGGHGGHQSRATDQDPDPATARKLAAMELEIARLRGELDVDRTGDAEPETIAGDRRRA